MNKSNYIEIAKILKKNYNCYPSDKLFFDLADYFEQQSPKCTNINCIGHKDRFNKEQFLKDCGIK